MIFLETDRLLFRSHEPQDENDFVAMHTDPEVRRYVGGSAWSFEKALDRFRNSYLGKPSKTYGLWAMVLKENGKYIGCCGINDPPSGPSPTLGFYIARPFWGRGLASEASNAFLEIGFGRLNLPRVFADVEKGHKVSEHILEKFGFRLTSEAKVPSGRVICRYQLEKADWERSQPREHSRG